MYEILRNALCWSISLVIKYSIDLCNKRIPELFQSVLPITFKLILTSTSMLSNHARVQIDARHQFISHLIINYLFILKKKILIRSEKLFWKTNNTVKNLTIMFCFYRDRKKPNYLIMQMLHYTEYDEGNYWKRFLSLSILHMSTNSVLTFTNFLMTNILIIITKINNECPWRITPFIFFQMAYI